MKEEDKKWWKQQIIGTLIAYGLIFIPLAIVSNLPEPSNKLFSILQILCVLFGFVSGAIVLFSTPAFKEKYGKNKNEIKEI